MNVATVTIDRDEAREQLREYRRALHKKADAEYERTAELYRHAALGRPIMNVRDAISNAPVDDRGRPRMAIALANATECAIGRGWPGNEFRFESEFAWPRRGRARAGSRIEIAVDRDIPPTFRRGFAMVPLVPPRIRRGRNLAKCFVLWEVEEWRDQSRTRPDRDPYLLAPIGGDLYAVLGEWDLTDVERLAMTGRPRS